MRRHPSLRDRLAPEAQGPLPRPSGHARALGPPGAPAVRRVAMISLHTSPLDQPGTGDAGGMNVYVLELSRRLAARGVAVDVFTRATSRRQAPVAEAASGVLVHHVPAGPFEGLTKEQLPAHLGAFAREVLGMHPGSRRDRGDRGDRFDVVHSHYWLSGQVGSLLGSCWSVSLVHSMHTMAKVKNALLADGDTPEPAGRVLGEQQVVEAADMLIANTRDEADQLVSLYGAWPEQVEIVWPGVDLEVFAPRSQAAARRRLGLPPDAVVPLFVGRLQPLKAPDVLVRAVAVLLDRDPGLRPRLVVPVVGGPSGTGMEHPEALAGLARSLEVDDVVRFVPPVRREELADWYAAATVVCVPSYNESFGLVAVEASAVGTPVVAAAVGGLPTVVRDQVTGLLVEGHDPYDYALALERVIRHPAYRDRLGRAAAHHARGFAWERTAEATLEVYRRAAVPLRELSGAGREPVAVHG